jgi:hypothetical protein
MIHNDPFDRVTPNTVAVVVDVAFVVAPKKNKNDIPTWV